MTIFSSIRKAAPFLALLLALTACARGEGAGPAAPGEGLTAQAVAQAALNSQEDAGDYVLLREEEYGFYLEAAYGLDGESWDSACVYAVGGVDAREIAAVRAAGEADPADLIRALEDYRSRRQGDFLGYVPYQSDLAAGGAVWQVGEYALLCICEDVSAAREALLQSAGVELPAVQSPTPAPEETFQMGEDWILFTPPNKHDMRLSDTAALRAAWAAGDAAGLGEEDAALYERCREIFDSCITGEMSEFEKELALHDWLLDNVSYDQSVYNAATPHGLPGSMGPGGPLLNGTGICLGYAESFRLLMDLAGIQCITVVGASYQSQEDHAWNMVCLEGEWYCVDATWNDTLRPTGGRSGEETRHTFFNVTSDFLRKWDHQWDYEAVPEATAERFRWEGGGARRN